MSIVRGVNLALLGIVCAAGSPVRAGAQQQPIVKFVSVPDFINMDFQLDDPRLMNLTNARKAQLVAEIAANGPQKQINPNVGNFVGTVENGYYGASQVLLEALAAENADFFTVSGDLNYTRWPKTSQLQGTGAANHIRAQADIYYDGWIGNVVNHSGFTLNDVYTIVGDHEIGDNNWSGNANLNAKRQLIPVYREVYVDKVGNEATIAQGAYVNAPAGFEGRTYAVQRGNVLLVGLDQFETFTAGGAYTNVGSQMASVKIDVTGTQLAWLDATLTQANADPTIDHIVVMAHAPIAAPDFVKVQATSSGLKNATNENGPLWQMLVEHGVALYLPGEVHAVSMQMADDLIQVVTGTNIFQPPDFGVDNIGFNLNAPITGEQNYMVVEAYEDRIDLTIKSIETKIWGNRGAGFDPVNDDPYKNREARVAIATADAGFQVVGTLTIDTSGDTPVYRNRTGLFLADWSFGAPVNIDLNGDGFIDDQDARDYLAGLHVDLSELTLSQAFAKGDLNGDGKNDYDDFRIFKAAFDVNNGEGAFEAAFAVPEPATAALLLVVAGLAGASRLRRKGKAVVAAACATVCLGAATPGAALAVNDVAGSLILFNDNGGWSWFEDERAIVDVAAGKILVSSVASVPPGDTPTDQPRNGDVEVASYDIASGAVTRFTLNAGTRPSGGLPADDHNSAALWQRPDGRYVAMYSGHHTDNLSRYRISTNPGDVSSWSAEQTFNNGINTTYSNLHYLSAENGGAGRLYNFTRTVGFDPNALVSIDQGASWSYGGRLLSWTIPAGDPKSTDAGGSGRPYLKYASNGVDEIHFITTEDHPRNYDNSVYHGVIRNGVVYDSFGNVVDGNFFDGTAASPNDFTAIFDTDSSSLGHAWTTDLQLDSLGRPYALMTARANNTNNSDHRFLYARFDGTQWSTHEVAKAGAFLYTGEGDYTGLGALDPHDPNRLFISTDVDPRNGDSLARYEIFQGITGDGGATWNWMAITANSTVDNLRPIVPKWDEEHTALLWMRGNYQEYRVYDMDVVGLTEITPIEILSAADLNGDGFVDPTDALMYLSGLHVDLTSLSAADARKKGDVNGDFKNDYSDFVIFRNAYEMHHGEGSLAAALKVPEPELAALIAGATAAWTAVCRRPASRR